MPDPFKIIHMKATLFFFKVLFGSTMGIAIEAHEGRIERLIKK